MMHDIDVGNDFTILDFIAENSLDLDQFEHTYHSYVYQKDYVVI